MVSGGSLSARRALTDESADDRIRMNQMSQSMDAGRGATPSSMQEPLMVPLVTDASAVVGTRIRINRSILFRSEVEIQPLK